MEGCGRISQVMFALPIILAAVYFPVQIVSVKDFYGLPPGPYCASRGGQCCPGRIDDCSYPIAETYCYCDDFCNRTLGRDDCCPDYWSFCKGISPPETERQCYANGKYYNHFQTVKDNCNTCKCTNVGERAELLCEKEVCLIEPDLISEVNRQNLGWEAQKHDEFWGRKLEEGIQKRLGTFEPNIYIRNINPVRKIYDPKKLPTSFEVDDKWSGIITPIQDQEWCGASWALSATSVASDRLAIMSKGKEVAKYSAQHLMSCGRAQQGCNGGHIDRAWSFLNKHGVVSDQCFPYEGKNTPCPYKRRGVGKLISATGCLPEFPSRKKFYATGPAYRLGNETDIMEEIYRNGPVQATMKVYQDFFSYHHGVYKHSPDAEIRRTGYHSVRIVGWGVDHGIFPPQKYWKVANTWGTQWGERGYFRIVRGKNECEIESYVIGIWAESALTRMRKSLSNLTTE